MDFAILNHMNKLYLVQKPNKQTKQSKIKNFKPNVTMLYIGGLCECTGELQSHLLLLKLLPREETQH